MTRSAAEVESEVEASRDRLDQTVEALKERMTPDHLMDDAAQAMSGVGQQIFSKLVEQAKQNPMPLAVMGAGLVWLITSSAKGASDGYSDYSGSNGSYGFGGSTGTRGRYVGSTSGGYGGSSSDYSDSSTGGGISEKLHDMGDKASDMVGDLKDKVSQAKDKVTQTASSAGDKLGQAVHGGGDLAGAAKDRTMRMGRQAMSGVSGLFEREPLVIAAVGLAIGAAIGAALPSTDLEDQTLGGARDQLLDKGKTLANDSVEQVKETAASTLDAVKEELGKPEHQGAGLQDKIQAAATVGTQTVKEHLGSA